ncbi:DUF922 domain-containing Zn-dependent protease [Thalassotalea piscium]
MKSLLIILILLSFYSNAQTKVVEDHVFYKVSAIAKTDLLKNLNNATPIREGGEVFHGHTKYDINWRFWWSSKHNQCKLTKVETTLKLKYTMPQLVTSNPDVKHVWSKWYPNLEKHEKGHGQLAKDSVYEIDKKLMSIGPKTSCNQLEKAANALGYKLMAKLNRANKSYDKKTNHGESQQAWLYMYL